MPLGKTLKALRQKQNLNQKALSALSGVSQATISRIETGRVRQLRSSALKNLADALGVSVDFLMGDNEVFASIPGPAVDGPTSTIPGVREDRFRQIADSLDAFVVHEQGRILYVNETFSAMLGYGKEELLGKNGIELFTAAQSRATVQRMVTTVSSDPYEALFVRKDGSIFPVEVAGKNINDSVRMAVVRNITGRRCQQAVARVQQAGLEADQLTDMDKVVRIMADELEDMGVVFEAVGVHIIDEPHTRLHTYAAYPESRGYTTHHDAFDLREAMQRHSSVRGLVSNWRRDKVWEREADEEFMELIQETSMGGTYRPSVVVDVPFKQGTLFIGVPSSRATRIDELVVQLRQLSQPISCVLKRLQEIEALRARLQEAQQARAPQVG